VDYTKLTCQSLLYKTTSYHRSKVSVNDLDAHTWPNWWTDQYRGERIS